MHVICTLLYMLVASVPMGAALSGRLMLALHLAVTHKRCAIVCTTFSEAALKLNFSLIRRQTLTRQLLSRFM